jgi:hypothetical protein
MVCFNPRLMDMLIALFTGRTHYGLRTEFCSTCGYRWIRPSSRFALLGLPLCRWECPVCKEVIIETGDNRFTTFKILKGD